MLTVVNFSIFIMSISTFANMPFFNMSILTFVRHQPPCVVGLRQMGKLLSWCRNIFHTPTKSLLYTIQHFYFYFSWCSQSVWINCQHWGWYVNLRRVRLKAFWFRCQLLFPLHKPCMKTHPIYIIFSVYFIHTKTASSQTMLPENSPHLHNLHWARLLGVFNSHGNIENPSIR